MIKLKKQNNNIITFDDALSYYDAMSCDKKKIFRSHFEQYYKATDIYVTYENLDNFYDVINNQLIKTLKAQKIKFNNIDIKTFNKLASSFFPFKDFKRAKNEILNENKIVPFNVPSIANQVKGSKFFQNSKVYAKFSSAKEGPFLAVSNTADENMPNRKTYYLDIKTLDTCLISQYSSSEDQIEKENQIGQLLGAYFKKLDGENAYYAFTVTKDKQKRAILSSMIDNKETPSTESQYDK